MRSFLAGALISLAVACSPAPQTETESTPATTEAAANAATRSAPAASAQSFNDAASYDQYEPRTPAASEDYNRSASAAGIRSCPELWAAATSDDVNGMQNILRSGVPIDCRDQTRGGSETALMAAAGGASADATRYLLDHGADISARDLDGATALGKALYMREQMASGGQLPMVVERFDVIIRLLRDRGAPS